MRLCGIERATRAPSYVEAKKMKSLAFHILPKAALRLA